MNKPPSTEMVWPVMYEDSSLAKKIASSAISLTEPSLFKGISCVNFSLAKEVGSRGITVNSIAPGFIETDMTSYLDENAKEKLTQDIPLKRLGSVNDIAELAIFLASDESSYITGQTISVDGGLFMY